MSALFRIVYATHANGTHHKLALDALNEMPRDDREAWSRVFMKHVARYLEGAKAPDNTFKDFKNHVLHVSENFWGGAPERAEAWYGRTVECLKSENWEDAAYSAGVLSHYYTDPIQPLHTGQCEAENAVHRAIEWSINRYYDALRAQGLQQYGGMTINVPTGKTWLAEFVCQGAEYSHRYYEKLIAHYDIHVGSVRPEEGLDMIARPIVGELLVYAAKGFGQVLDRAIAEAGVAAPEITLTAETFLAAAQIPQKWIEKRLTNAEDRKLVQAIYDELKTTGRVDKALPEDDRTIRDLHAKEVLAPKAAEKSAARLKKSVSATSARKDLPDVPPGPLAIKQAKAAEVAAAKEAAARAAAEAKPKGSKARTLPKPESKAPPPAPEPKAKTPAPPVLPKAAAAAPAADAADGSLPLSSQVTFAKLQAPSAKAQPSQKAAPQADRRNYLAASDPLEAAPSIGPKLAQLFADLDINTVGEFLGNSPHDLAELLDDQRFDAETITDWQDQARLVMDVPGLRGTHAQLLVGSGYRTAEAVADADAGELSADVLKFATTQEGRRILRDGDAPDLEKIKTWVDWARLAIAA